MPRAGRGMPHRRRAHHRPAATGGPSAALPLRHGHGAASAIRPSCDGRSRSSGAASRPQHGADFRHPALPVPAFSFSPRAGHSCGKRATRFPNPYLPFFPDLWNKVFLYYSEIINLFKKRLTFALQPFTRLPQNAAKKHLFQINTQEHGKIGKKPFPAGFALSLALVPAPWQPTCIWPPCRTLPGICMFPTQRYSSR